ncbi:methyl-accepting chemotaxis protein [Paenibacillus macquariensis]|uniref:Methyl-accepting chemotaxis protein n=1 Tax=Paenibacillus macquariensis TaxID=948756 RepID=A0ABY1K3H3_9BACL|nr:HAMP domain-containing methyl-accepting chemotaxis protein [Paenibacillus macquariensis]MEC0090342.1 HAMP domain-containing methyl-accepting chemotaxis protein [Paenibacillus macquariensis]OAB39697.1 hypothetical protein PMSM_00795 [Paenibacillus macquariensis subsp. macquariensis]SIR19685.1 methyl-accepting chemotaxis protein [Paenibacillus macquariensis]
MKKLIHLKVSSKILGLLVLALLLLCLIGFLAFSNISKINNNANLLYNEKMQPIDLTHQLITNHVLIGSNQLELMLTNNSTVRQKINSNSDIIIENNLALMSELERIGLTSELEEKYTFFKELIHQSDEEFKIMLTLLENDKIQEALAQYDVYLKPLRDQIISTLTEINTMTQIDSLALNESNQKVANTSKRNTIFIFLAALFMCSIGGFIISRSITRPLSDISSLMVKAQAGDLSVQGLYQSKDEIGVLTSKFNEMIIGLRGVMTNISMNADLLSASSQQLLTNAQQSSEANEQITLEIQEITEGSDIQLSTSQECVTAMEEVSLGIQRVAKSASQVSDISQFATQKAHEGSIKIQHVSQQMDSILQTSQESTMVIKQLEQQSSEIGNIVSMIKDISGQINLLALNASIEAARAGEHGRGFAVVASEVRKLAEQSNRSSGQISSIIVDIQASTNRAVTIMEKESKEVHVGLLGMGEAKESFHSIVNSVNEVSQQLEEVSAASQQISASAEEVMASLHQMQQISNNNYDRTQNVAAASEEQLATMNDVNSAVHTLSDMAQELQEQSSKFKM